MMPSKNSHTRSVALFLFAVLAAGALPAVAQAHTDYGTVLEVGVQSDGTMLFRPSVINVTNGCNYGFIYWSSSMGLAADAFKVALSAYLSGKVVRYDYTNSGPGTGCTLSLIMAQ